MIITFFGHSNYREAAVDEKKLLSFLEETVGSEPVEFFLGGYGGFDAFARRCAKKFQKEHGEARVVFVTPYIHRGAPPELYDEILYPDLENVPPRFAISRRNKWMVEKANFVVAYIDRSFGGAFQACAYARKKKKPVFNLTGQDF